MSITYAHPEDLNKRFTAMRGAKLPRWAVEVRDETLIRAVKEQALKWYDKGWCWDYVLECLSDKCIADLIGKARTEAGAIKNVYHGYVRLIQTQAANAVF